MNDDFRPGPHRGDRVVHRPGLNPRPIDAGHLEPGRLQMLDVASLVGHTALYEQLQHTVAPEGRFPLPRRDRQIERSQVAASQVVDQVAGAKLEFAVGSVQMRAYFARDLPPTGLRDPFGLGGAFLGPVPCLVTGSFPIVG